MTDAEQGDGGRREVWQRLAAEDRADALEGRPLKRMLYVFLAVSLVPYTARWLAVDATLIRIATAATVSLGVLLVLMCAAYLVRGRRR